MLTTRQGEAEPDDDNHLFSLVPTISPQPKNLAQSSLLAIAPRPAAFIALKMIRKRKADERMRRPYTQLQSRNVTEKNSGLDRSPMQEDCMEFATPPRKQANDHHQTEMPQHPGNPPSREDSMYRHTKRFKAYVEERARCLRLRLPLPVAPRPRTQSHYKDLIAEVRYWKQRSAYFEYRFYHDN